MSPVEFDQPPINEVVCGILFRRLEMPTAEYGRLWRSIAEEFPLTADAPLLVRGDATEIRPGDSRVWFLSADQRYILQLQRDRLHFNWRRMADTDVYPRFDAVYAGFERHLATVAAFVTPFGALEAERFELTYVNVIPLPEKRYGVVGQILDTLPWTGRPYMPEPEGFSWAVEGPAPLGMSGRLKVSAQMAQVRATPEQSVVKLELTVGGLPEDSGTPGMPMDDARRIWFEQAHEGIVRSFVELTSNSAHTTWGKR